MNVIETIDLGYAPDFLFLAQCQSALALSSHAHFKASMPCVSAHSIAAFPYTTRNNCRKSQQAVPAVRCHTTPDVAHLRLQAHPGSIIVLLPHCTHAKTNIAVHSKHAPERHLTRTH